MSDPFIKGLYNIADRKNCNVSDLVEMSAPELMAWAEFYGKA